MRTPSPVTPRLRPGWRDLSSLKGKGRSISQEPRGVRGGEAPLPIHPLPIYPFPVHPPWVRSHLHPSQHPQCKTVQGRTWIWCLHPECSSRTPIPSRGIQAPKGLPCDHRRPILPHLISQSQPFGLFAVVTDLKGFKTPSRHGLGGFLPLTQSTAVGL